LRPYAAGVVAALSLSLFLGACESGGGSTPSASAQCESVTPTPISADEAVEAGKREAAYIIQDQEVGRSSARWMSFGDALEEMGAGPNFSGWEASACVWLVSLDGFFYAPAPPVGPTGLETPRGPVCGRIGVAIRPDTGAYLHITFQEIADCG